MPADDDETPEYHVMETGLQHARYAILEYKNSNWQAEMITVGYDHQQAAQQARKNGRLDWEYAPVRQVLKVIEHLEDGYSPINSQA